jgi:formamidopyrimidine-DNA glycosylase
MPELPDVDVYVEAVRKRVQGHPLRRVRLNSPFLLRSVTPSLKDTEGKTVTGVRRLGKRVVLVLEDDLFLAIHLMIAGRLHWKPTDAKLAGKLALAAFDFEHGTLTLTEAGSKKRASLHVVRGENDLKALARGGIEPVESTLAAFTTALTRENRTLKRALTDPSIFSGIGNSYSDEILHAAKLSPAQLSRNLDDDEVARLHRATVETLTLWRDRLSKEAGDAFPEKVTAFREGMAVHGRYRQPCPTCGSPVQRIVYAANEANYCARCQTGGRLLADRALSRLLGKDWPKTLEELEGR